MLETALSVLGALVALVVLAGATYAAFRASVLRTTVEDLRGRVGDLVSERNELERRLEKEVQAQELLKARLDLVEQRASQLEEIVSGRIDFAALESRLDHHHAEMAKRLDTHHDAVCAELKDVKAILGDRRSKDAK